MELLDHMGTLAANGIVPNEYRATMKTLLDRLRSFGDTGNKEQLIESAYRKELVAALVATYKSQMAQYAH